VILSPNPVVVRGNTQISWDRLGYSVIYLSSIHLQSIRSKRHDVTASSSDLNHWTDIMGKSRIFTYWKFCRSTHTAYQRLRLSAYLLTVLSAVITNSLLYIGLVLKPNKVFIIGVALTWFVHLCVLLALPLQDRIFRLRRNPRFFNISKVTLAMMERRIGRNVHERILDTLRTRDATEPRDMSFGLNSILERLPGHTGLPIINPKAPLLDVYLQLTLFLLHNSKSLSVLTLAARHRCQGAPSWVPDFSWVDSAESIDAGPNHAPPGYLNRSPKPETDVDQWAKILLQSEDDMASICAAVYREKLPFQHHVRGHGILVVKGIFLGHISAVSVREGYGRQRSERISGIETALYSGLAFEGCRVGDKVVLIVGLQRPLIVRNSGSHCKIVGATALIHRRRLSIKQFWYWCRGTKDYIKYGETWRAHDRKRKEEWKRKNNWTDSEAEPHPLTYLEDILIS
jgi:hypothetical protein